MGALDAYTAFLGRFFGPEHIPAQLLSNLHVQGRRIFHDPLGLGRYAEERKLEPFSVGIFLGEALREFTPSPACIQRIGSLIPRHRRALVDDKAAWLWLCGRDILGKGFEAGNPERGLPVIVEDTHGDVLGYGTWLVDRVSSKERNRPVIKNKLDLGAYLRREIR